MPLCMTAYYVHTAWATTDMVLKQWHALAYHHGSETKVHAYLCLVCNVFSSTMRSSHACTHGSTCNMVKTLHPRNMLHLINLLCKPISWHAYFLPHCIQIFTCSIDVGMHSLQYSLVIRNSEHLIVTWFCCTALLLQCKPSPCKYTICTHP